jgi:hypothetical protein
VLIGLVIGATTTGQQLISSARVSRSVAYAQGVTTAYLAYLDRYRALPGDDAQASNRWPGAKSGNGDGQISGLFDAAPPADSAALVVNATEGENLNFWWHLRLAGLISGAAADDSSASPPIPPLGGQAGIQQDAYGMRGASLCMANVPSGSASAIDARADEGYPDRGAIRGASESGGVPPSLYPVSDEPYILCLSVAGSTGGPAVALNSSGGGGSSSPGGGGGTTSGGGTTGTGGSGWGGGGWGGGGHGGGGWGGPGGWH